jgi:hypothetical protein
VKDAVTTSLRNLYGMVQNLYFSLLTRNENLTRLVYSCWLKHGRWGRLRFEKRYDTYCTCWSYLSSVNTLAQLSITVRLLRITTISPRSKWCITYTIIAIIALMVNQKVWDIFKSMLFWFLMGHKILMPRNLSLNLGYSPTYMTNFGPVKMSDNVNVSGFYQDLRKLSYRQSKF